MVLTYWFREYLRDISCAEDKLEGYYALKLDHCFNTGDELSFLLRPTCEDGKNEGGNLYLSVQFP